MYLWDFQKIFTEGLNLRKSESLLW